MHIKVMMTVVFFGLIQVLSLTASALPVLRESAGDFGSSMVTIYPDHRDPNLFYFLPNQLDFAKDRSTGLPGFSLQTYGLEQSDLKQMGGYFTFVFRPAISADVQQQLEAFQKKYPRARLAPVPIGESYMTIGQNRLGIPHESASGLFTHLDLPPYGGLLETEVGGNGYLTGLGAKVMTQAVKGNQPLVLNYCFSIDGVTPFMDADIDINYQKVFEHWKAKARVGWWIFGADVVKEVTKLTESGAIKIRVHGDTKFEDVIFELARDLAKQYLKPVLENRPSDVQMGSSPFRFVRFGFGSTRIEERRSISVRIQKQANLTDARCIAAPFRGLKPYADQLITNTRISFLPI